jgi:hypothetical protein
MKKFLLIFLKIVLIGVTVVLLLAASLFGLFWYVNRPVSDNQLIKSSFMSKLPGYSSIKVIKRIGEGTVENPRVLIIEVALESYDDPLTCRGEIRYIRGDPSFRDLRWYDWTCISHWNLLEIAWDVLLYDEGPTFCQTQIEDVALVLEHWVEKGCVNIDQIRRSEVREQVDYLLKNNIPPSKPAELIDISKAHVIDLSPGSANEKKVPTYVIRCDGSLDLILRGGPGWWNQSLDLHIGDTVLPAPIQETTIKP